MTWYIIEPDKPFTGIALAVVEESGFIEKADGYHYPISFEEYKLVEKKPELYLVSFDEFEQMRLSYEKELALQKQVNLLDIIGEVSEEEYLFSWKHSVRSVKSPHVNFFFTGFKLKKRNEFYFTVKGKFFNGWNNLEKPSEVIGKEVLNWYYEQFIP